MDFSFSLKFLSLFQHIFEVVMHAAGVKINKK